MNAILLISLSLASVALSPFQTDCLMTINSVRSSYGLSPLIYAVELEPQAQNIARRTYSNKIMVTSNYSALAGTPFGLNYYGKLGTTPAAGCSGAIKTWLSSSQFVANTTVLGQGDFGKYAPFVHLLQPQHKFISCGETYWAFGPRTNYDVVVCMFSSTIVNGTLIPSLVPPPTTPVDLNLVSTFVTPLKYSTFICPFWFFTPGIPIIRTGTPYGANTCASVTFNPVDGTLKAKSTYDGAANPKSIPVCLGSINGRVYTLDCANPFVNGLKGDTKFTISQGTLMNGAKQVYLSAYGMITDPALCSVDCFPIFTSKPNQVTI